MVGLLLGALLPTSHEGISNQVSCFSQGSVHTTEVWRSLFSLLLGGSLLWSTSHHGWLFMKPEFSLSKIWKPVPEHSAFSLESGSRGHGQCGEKQNWARASTGSSSKWSWFISPLNEGPCNSLYSPQQQINIGMWYLWYFPTCEKLLFIIFR